MSIPGTLPGQTMRLFNGQYVPTIEINLTRGLYGWSIAPSGVAFARSQSIV
ncbi:hypothetical protein ACIBI9_62830 [Nonomuraea sp. NPDC050451]|uniref:hypothetical protein n=1 Tax=Nonomuraea sp. NPDC050451 TaxID=3364364 RepID=UPI0037AD3E26